MPLSPHGRWQAAQLGKTLRNLQVQRLKLTVSSVCVLCVLQALHCVPCWCSSWRDVLCLNPKLLGRRYSESPVLLSWVFFI